jgi:hypothetical protein
MSHIKQVKGSSIKTFHNNISEREKIGPFLSETDCMLYLAHLLAKNTFLPWIFAYVVQFYI